MVPLKPAMDMSNLNSTDGRWSKVPHSRFRIAGTYQIWLQQGGRFCALPGGSITSSTAFDEISSAKVRVPVTVNDNPHI